MKILLINSGNDEYRIGNANISCYPPLGIISIATTIKKFWGNLVEIRLIDGQIDSINETVNTIKTYKPNIICISMYCTTISYSMKCAQVGKEVGATIILGNDHAKAHYDTLLSYSDCIDYVSLDEFGERTMFYYLNRIYCPNNSLIVPLIAYKDSDNSIVTIGNSGFNLATPIWADPLDFFPLPDRTLLNEKYWATYRQNFGNIVTRLNKNNINGITTVNRLRGCPEYNRKCLYCGIGDLKPCISKCSYWDDILAAQQQIGANVFYECCDNMSAFLPYLRRVLDSKPNPIDANFLFYASALGISEETCTIMKEIGAFCLNFGFDSGNERSLQILKGKRHSISDNKSAAQIVTKQGLELHTSFVLFGLGNKTDSLNAMKDSLRFAQWLTENTNVTTLECALLYPDKASPVGGLIWNPNLYKQVSRKYDLTFLDMSKIEKMHKKYKDMIFIDPNEIVSEFAEACGTEVSLLLEYQSKIKDCCRNANIRFGYSQYGKDPS